MHHSIPQSYCDSTLGIPLVAPIRKSRGGLQKRKQGIERIRSVGLQGEVQGSDVFRRFRVWGFSTDVFNHSRIVFHVPEYAAEQFSDVLFEGGDLHFPEREVLPVRSLQSWGENAAFGRGHFVQHHHRAPEFLASSSSLNPRVNFQGSL